MLSDNDLELLSAYLDGALSEAERAALEKRLQDEPDLRRELARLRATVDLVGTLPTLTAPRDFTLSRRMARRPSVWTSASFSALSAAAAVILLVIGAALFGTSGQLAKTTAPAQVAFAPTATSLARDQALDEEANGVLGSNSPQAIVPEINTEAAQESNDLIQRAAPTGTPAPTIMLFSAALPTAAPALQQAQSDAAVAPLESGAGQPSSAQPAPAAAGGAAAEAPQPASTQPPSATPSDTPTATLTHTATPAPTSTPSATLAPTTAPTLLPPETPPATPQAQVSTVGVGLIVVALVLFGVAIITTLLRRRS